MADTTLAAPCFFEKYRGSIAVAGPDQCWLWTAGKFDTGYGSVSIDGVNYRAHRLAYEAAHGEGSADGFVVRHGCDTPACVNPAHLELGTQADNLRDMIERGRHVSPKGSEAGRAKLTDADVVAIRSAYVRGSSTHGIYGLASDFGVHPSLISRIIRRELWAHL